MKTFLISYVIMINLIGLFLMGLDKRRAVRRTWRISEKTLFITALLFGSIGILIGMYLFRHKTRHLSFALGIPVILVLQLCVISLLFYWNRARMGSPSQAVQHELELIRNLDSDTIRDFVSYESLFHSQITSGPIDESTSDAVNLFFRDFTYEIHDEALQDDQAVVTASITNIDMHALAEDLCKEILRESVAIFPSDSSRRTTSDYYQMLGAAISSGSYDSVTTSATFHLKREDGVWVILVDAALEDELVSGFISYMNDPFILSAKTALSIHLDALCALDATQWTEYLSIEDVFATYNSEYYPLIDEAYTRQLAADFDYEILRCTTDGSNATADIRIRSIDMTNVLTIYKRLLLEYAATSKSIRDDSETFSDETSRLLLQALEENEKSASTDIRLTFQNNGDAWEIYFSDDFTDALMGGIREALEAFNSLSRESDGFHAS